MATQQQTFDFLMANQQVVAGRSGSLAIGCQPLPTLLPEDPSAQQTPAEGPDRQAVLRQLRAKVGCINTAPESNRQATFSTGSVSLDRLLPEGGLRTNAITEWVAEGEGSGAASLALLAAANQLRVLDHSRGPLVVVSDHEHFYPPAAIALGIPAERIIWVRPRGHADLIWSIDQALRCESVAAVWAPVGASLDDRDARRFQLAAEAGRTPGLFVRPAVTRHRPSFAEIRWHIANQPASRHRDAEEDLSSGGRLLKVTLDRCRGGRLGESVWIRICDQGAIETVIPRRQVTWKDEKATVHLASELAHPKTSLRGSQWARSQRARSQRAKRA